jgi:hypothetical protein
MSSSSIIRNILGLTIFSYIMLSTVFVENIEKFDSIVSRLPMRMTLTAKQDLNLYLVGYESERKKTVGILKSGETVEFEAWVCPYKQIRLSNGERYLISAEENEVEIKLLKFYYF